MLQRRIFFYKTLLLEHCNRQETLLFLRKLPRIHHLQDTLHCQWHTARNTRCQDTMFLQRNIVTSKNITFKKYFYIKKTSEAPTDLISQISVLFAFLAGCLLHNSSILSCSIGFFFIMSLTLFKHIVTLKSGFSS